MSSNKITRGMTSRRALAITAAVVLAAGLAACSTPSEGPGSTATPSGPSGELHQLGHVLQPTTDDGQCWEEFVADIVDSTDLNLVTAPAGALGNEPEIYQNLAAGAFQFAGLSTSQLGGAFPKLNVLTFPFIFEDHDHALAAWNSPAGQALRDEFAAETGITILGACSSVFRDLATNTPVRTPADVEGLVLRVPSTEISLAMWQALGAIPRDVPHSEAYQALQTGLVDGADYPFGSITGGKFYEATDYFSQTGHSWLAQTILVRTDFFESLDAATQNALREAAQKQTDKVFDIAKTSLARESAVLEQHGTVVDGVDSDAFRNATEAVVAELVQRYGVEELYAQFRALAQ